MTCPVCGETLRITDTWQYDVDITLRKRRCIGCDKTIYTKEEECAPDLWGPGGWRVRPEGRRHGGGKTPKWNVEKGRAMYEAGASIADIARAVGRRYSLVYNYALNHWFHRG